MCICALLLSVAGAGGRGGRIVHSATVDDNAQKYHFKMDKKSIGSIATIKANLGKVDFEIKPSEDNNFYLSYKVYSKKNLNPLEYEYDGKDKVLAIKTKKCAVSGKFIWKKNGKTYTQNYLSKVTVWVPKETVLDNSVIKSDMGDVAMKEVSMKNGTLITGMGDVDMENLSVSGTTKISMDMGDIFMRNVSVSGAAEISTDMGDIDMKNLSVSGTAKVYSDMGDITLSLDKECIKSLSVYAKADIGKITAKDLSGSKTKKKGGGYVLEKIINNTDNYLEVTADMGDIVLQ